jgi:hypothetical protein
MDLLREHAVACPYCGETITVVIDCSIPDQSYVEDCQVCCQPIVFEVEDAAAGEPSVAVRQENE